MIVVNGVLYHSEEEIKDDSYIVDDGVLMHHGIKGQKWGQRKKLYDRYKLSFGAKQNLQYNFNKHGKNTNKTHRQDLALARKNAKARAITGFALSALNGAIAAKAAKTGQHVLAAMGNAAGVLGLVNGIIGSTDMAKISRIQNGSKPQQRAKK